MTPSQIQSYAAAVRALWPAGQKTMAKDAMSKLKGSPAIPGSDLEQVYKAIQAGRKSSVSLVWLDAFLTGGPVVLPPASSVTVACPTCGGSGRVPASVEPPPIVPPAPPVVKPPEPVPPNAEPTEAKWRNLFNDAKFGENKATLGDGRAVSIQNSNRPGTTQWDGADHFIFDLKDSTDQRPSEKKPKGTKRRSEVSSIKAVAPTKGQVQVFSGEVLVHAQPFADNQQWVLAQRHGAPTTGHPEVAFRIEKGGYAILSTCSAIGVESIDIRALVPGTKTKRLMPTGVWRKAQIKDFGGRVELWIGGELWVTSNNPANYPGDGTPYWKFGVYNSQGSDEHTTVEWRGVRLTYEAA